MNSEEMLALAARCQQASGPDRGLDLAIYHIVQPKRYRWAEFVGLYDQDTIAIEEPPAYVAAMIEAQGHVPRSLWEPDVCSIPRYTASLDAAMTLCEPHWWVNMSAPLSPEAYGYSREESRQPRAGMECIGEPYSQGAAAATMALAVCAMALKARARAHSPEQLKGEGR